MSYPLRLLPPNLSKHSVSNAEGVRLAKQLFFCAQRGVRATLHRLVAMYNYGGGGALAPLRVSSRL